MITREELIEKMARAMHENDNGLRADTAWDDLFHSTRKLYLEQAEAALDALLSNLKDIDSFKHSWELRAYYKQLIGMKK